MGKLRLRKWGSAWRCLPHPWVGVHMCVHRCSTQRLSETVAFETPAPTPSSKLEAAQPTAPPPSEASSLAVTSQEKRPAMISPLETPRVPWQSPEGPFPQLVALETTHPSRKELFFWGHPTTLGALQVIIGLLHVSCGAVLAAVPNLAEFVTTYWYPLAGGALFFIAGAATLITAGTCTLSRTRVSAGLNLASWLCADLGMCTLFMELAASSRYAQVLWKSLSVLLLLFSILELGIASTCTFRGFQAAFCYTWLYLNPAEDVPMATAAPRESPSQQVQQPPATV